MCSRTSGSQFGGNVRGAIRDGAVVVTLTVKAEGEFPVGMTDVGRGAQVAWAGAPVQVSATERLNWLMGVTWRL